MTPTPEQQSLIRDAVASGRLHGPEDAMQEALSLWAEREHRRAEILTGVERAERSLARGEGCAINIRERTTQLAADIKQRGTARLADEHAG